ncbi:3-phosphoserine/phosphohydroxythreonine transaminase [Chryseobacterium sp. 6424]|uniref:3-phosphoserine/phosphohydroxythreonine transaminase n=1 Tax=Chryseobacterium sp. 6424 TaxID=2039166 RepID=UPI000EFD4629|nr:3-phosphoserine/phosphohydroxythreonine transaminase [Chryseobacterium sp. 6424]AYO57832.1 3-phosphoserine/phosphohydroxythreonine transaminase [Chryseobacterium sp. 6424]
MNKIHNFSAGPCILPQEVYEKSAEAVLNFNGSELSLLEISHRSKDFVAVMDEARAIVKRLMKLGDEYEVLYLGGGASLQFLMVPFNLLKADGGKAAYLDTGTWAAGAIKEAKYLGDVDVVGSSKKDNYAYIPTDYIVGSGYDYFHCTSNNTIYGTQMKEFPEVDTLMACDMSSDIFSRKIDFSKFDLIYAGAQKNMGPAGVTLVVVKKSILGKTGRTIPSYLNYQLHIEKESMLNTPPVFPVYASLLTLQQLEKNGGIAAAEQRNIAKAQLLYDEIDRNPYFETFCRNEDRSLMNVSFKITDESRKSAFDEAWKAAGISGLNGHRSLGGYRASLYNAMPIESVQVLVDVMKNFA